MAATFVAYLWVLLSYNLTVKYPKMMRK